MNKALLVLPFIVLSLLVAVWSGWLRIGWSLPLSNAAAQHGALMVGSFLATLIFLERAVTFRQKWVLLLPAVNGLSVGFFLAAKPLLAQLCLVAGSGGFVVLCIYFVYRYRELYYYLFLAGAVALLGGNIMVYKTHFYPAAVNWWMAFLLFTIVAERLELSRFLAIGSFVRALLMAALALVLFSIFLPFHGWGKGLFALGLAATAVWLLRYDMAWKSIKIKGQHRYSGLLLIIGYAWLLVTAALLLVNAANPYQYDAALHAFFIGFVFSMIFSHAPIILPAVLKLPVKLFRPWLYYLFVLLQATLLLRLAADVAQSAWLRKWGGIGNGWAILIFFASVACIVKAELKQRGSLRKA